MRLLDKVVLVTGSTTGIGEAIARRVVAEGGRVLIHGRDAERGRALVEELGGKATLHVEKEGQRGILIGKGGERIKQIGTGARQRIEELSGRKVYLELFVRVTPRWKNVPRQLSELGYEAPELEALADAERALPLKKRGERRRP